MCDFFKCAKHMQNIKQCKPQDMHICTCAQY